MPTPSRGGDAIIPPAMDNEIELVVRNYKDNVILQIAKLLETGDYANKIKDFHGTTIYSEWKEIPNFVFRIMFFPVCPHSEGNLLEHYKISAYVEATKKEDWPENWMCYGTRFCIIVVHPKEPHNSIFKRDTFNFSKTETDRGWQGILTLSQIIEGGYLTSGGDLVIRAGVYPVGAEIDRSSRDPAYNCREATGFVGLQNHGATCYMNALLQSLYSITKFRKAVYKLSFDMTNVVGPKSYEIAKKLTKAKQKLKREETEYEMDVDNPYPESNVNTARKEEEEEYDFEENEFEKEEKLDELVEGMDEKDYCHLLLEEEEEKKKVPCVGMALQNLFYLLNYSQESPPCKELMKSFGWDSSDMFTQQDSHELLKLLLDKMEEQMKGTAVEGSVKNIFEGEMETYIECIDINYKSCRKETFEDIQLDVQGCNNIYESLDKLTEPELLAGENMYEAKGHGKQRANKGIRFLKFPPVVLFLLKRFTFDLAKMDTVKLNSRFEFYKEINLEKYIEEDNKEEGDGEKEEKDYEYELQAVSVHHGSINSGHYYAFAKKDSDWLKFDDEIVTKVSEYAVINDNFGGEEQECYNYLTTNTNNQSVYNNNSNRYRRNKVYNAYILMYVLKSKKGEILGEVDVQREDYQMVKRCKIQKLLTNIRIKLREKLNRFIKVKVYKPEDFEGNTLLNQHFNTWPAKIVITQDKSANLNELLKQIQMEVEESREWKKEDNEDVYYYVLGLNKQFNKFLCLNEVKNKHKIKLETVSDLSQLIRKEYYQQYDPTLYILYVNAREKLSEFETYEQKKKEQSKGVVSKIKMSPRTSLDVFSPTSSTSGSMFTPTSSVFTASTLLYGVNNKPSPLYVFIKYYDIFTKDSKTNLKCIKLAHVNTERKSSQLAPIVIEALIEWMTNNAVNKYRLKDMKNIIKTIQTLYQSNENKMETNKRRGSSGEDQNENKEEQKESKKVKDEDVLLLDEEEEEMLIDLDGKIELLMKKESMHLYWYVEMDNSFTNLSNYKKLGDQLKNGDIIVCNFRPTDEMRREIEHVEKKTNQKEDFEPTSPSCKKEQYNNFILITSDKYIESQGIKENETIREYKEIKKRWKEEKEEKIKMHKLYTLSIYDYPSYIQWKLNNIKVVFKLYDPLESLAMWKNCSNSQVVELRGESKEKEGLSGREGEEDKEKVKVQEDKSEKSKEKEKEEGLLGKYELVVDLRTPCKHVLRYVCWEMGVDPCHVLIFNNVPNAFEAVGSNLFSLDDFCNKDNSLGYSQQSLLLLFNAHGTFVTHPNFSNTYENGQDKFTYNQNNYVNESSMDNESMESEEMEDSNETIRQLTKYNLRKLGSARSRSVGTVSEDNENVVYMGVMFEPYYMWNFKSNENTINVVAQVFNEKVQVVASLMCKIGQSWTVGQLCHQISQNYLEFINSTNASNKRGNQTFERGKTISSEMEMEEEEEMPDLVLVDVLGSMYKVVELESKVIELPQYSNGSVRNLFAAPLRFVPNWTHEQQELLKQKKLCALTVVHQTPEREIFGHPFQVLVPPNWSFQQIKTHIRSTLDIPKREWDRWTFYQVTDQQVRTWKANDDLLDWDKPGLRLLAEHPRPSDKHRPHGVMKIT